LKNKPYIILILFLVSSRILAQNPHPYFQNYTTEHGLPSSEIHCTVEDKNGYIWIATDNGLSRFDGYEFKNYGTLDGLENTVIFYLQIAPDGLMWMATV